MIYLFVQSLNVKQFYLTHKIRPNQVPLLRAKVVLEAMVMEENSGFPQSSIITEALPLDCLMSYPGHSLVGSSYPSAEMESVYSTAPADCAGLERVQTF